MARPVGELFITLGLKGKKFADGLKRSENLTKKFAQRARRFMGSAVRQFAMVTAAVVAMGYALKKVLTPLVDAANKMERYGVVLNKTLGSMEKANELLRYMSKYARTVSPKFEELASASVTLSAVVSGGVPEIKKWLPIIADLSAYGQNLGITMQETTAQIVRFFSSGAAAADLFREKGINAMLGFKAGVSYSVDETKEKLLAAWNEQGSKFRDLAKDMTTTWTGMVGMLADRWFLARKEIMEGGLFEYMKGGLDDIIKAMDRWSAQGTFITIGVQVASLSTALGILIERMSQYIGQMKAGAKFNLLVMGGRFGEAGAMYEAAGLARRESERKIEGMQKKGWKIQQVGKLRKKINTLEQRAKQKEVTFAENMALREEGSRLTQQAETLGGTVRTIDYGDAANIPQKAAGGGRGFIMAKPKTTFRDPDTYGYFERKRAWQREQEMIDSMTADVSGIFKYAPEGEGGLSASEQRFMSFGQNLQDSWLSTMENMMSGTARFGDFFKNMMNDILSSYFSAVAQMAGQSLFDVTRGIFSTLPGFDESGIDPVTPMGRAADDQRFGMD